VAFPVIFAPLKHIGEETATGALHLQGVADAKILRKHATFAGLTLRLGQDVLLDND